MTSPWRTSCASSQARRSAAACGAAVLTYGDAFAGRHEEWVPRSKRLLSDGRSNVLVYMTGHGGDEFLKFQDQARVPH